MVLFICFIISFVLSFTVTFVFNSIYYNKHNSNDKRSVSDRSKK